MKKVYLTQIMQHNTTFYIGKYDPRKLVRLIDQDIDVGATQEAQRPLEKTHLKEISDFVVSSDGLLPSSIMIATRNNMLTIEQEICNENGQVDYFMMFPETEEELTSFNNTIDVIDGQHRLFSFSQKYISADFSNEEVFEIPFSLFIVPTLRTRQLLFTITNEKQKAVSKNLLFYLKKQLQMLTPAENNYYPLIEKLNNENSSPLKGRIIMSAEKISKGYKATELIKIFNKVDVISLREGEKNDHFYDVLYRMISIYLNAWESHYHVKFSSPQGNTMAKISGIRYIMHLLPTFYDHSRSSQKSWIEPYVTSIIKDLESVKGLLDNETLFDNSMVFRGESNTVKQASVDANQLKNYLTNKSNESFDPMS